MGKRHFLFFDFLLPIAGILLIGRILAQRFDYHIFHFLDTIRAFGLGFWFAESGLRVKLLHASPYIFAFFPATGWAAWMRLNLELDRATGAIRLDRPIYRFCSGLVRKIRSSVRSPEQFPSAIPPVSSTLAAPTLAPMAAAVPSSAPMSAAVRSQGPTVPSLAPIASTAAPTRPVIPLVAPTSPAVAPSRPAVPPLAPTSPAVSPLRPTVAPSQPTPPTLAPMSAVVPPAQPALPQPSVVPSREALVSPVRVEPVHSAKSPAGSTDDVMPPAPAPAPRRPIAPGPAYPGRAR